MILVWNEKNCDMNDVKVQFMKIKEYKIRKISKYSVSYVIKDTE